MLYPKVDAKQWCQRYQISDRTHPCPQCQTPLEFNVPIAMKDYRGLETSPCSNCGEVSGIFRVVPLGDKLIFWNSLKDDLIT